ncbi:hypothetical protein GGQ85_001584 [Nitrobacter vulgaris]|uniref:hypothetical protein n=1 Tax=Nitrobacter vulgaris TaxID=29421 RepID=UPI002865A671|nr:hypothetical protein [Nitrobacter vulgaris]MDR6303888.1 hypothetical protein [Nitrobacter vulgaris]
MNEPDTHYRRKAFAHVDPTHDCRFAGGKLGSAYHADLPAREFRRNGDKTPTLGGSNPLGCLVFAGLGAD